MNTSYLSPQLDAAFTAMGHGKRRGMLYTLSFRPATVTQLADEFDLSLPAIHKHIRALEKASLIERKKVGRTNFVALNKKSLRAVQAWIMQFRADWGNDNETLENYIASMKD
jgi:DNA-binding transcriptional ArsR family regulator